MSVAFNSVKEFHEVFGHPVGAPMTAELAQFRNRLINEEANEVEAEIYNADNSWEPFPGNKIDKVNLTKELADMLYVIYGFAVAAGLPLDEAFDEVHRSNMSKLGDDGKPIYREDGKVLKGPNYSEANIGQFFGR